jgi:hypothetical protein
MSKGMSKRRKEMGEDTWEEYQRKRKIEKADRYRNRNAENVVNYRRNVKVRLIEYKGGKCFECGYDKIKYPSAFHFHHRDPTKKEVRIGGSTLAYETLKKEAEKCDLLCANCHAETHDKEFEIERNKTIEKYKKRSKKIEKNREIKNTKICINCDEKFIAKRITQKFCSRICSDRENGKKRRKVIDRPNKGELKSMIKTMSWCAIGRKYNVSDNAVRKWAKSFNL